MLYSFSLFFIGYLPITLPIYVFLSPLPGSSSQRQIYSRLHPLLCPELSELSKYMCSKEIGQRIY